MESKNKEKGATSCLILQKKEKKMHNVKEKSVILRRFCESKQYTLRYCNNKHQIINKIN